MHSYTEDDVRVRAYMLWLEAGLPDGRDVEFWLVAEQELAEKDKPPQSELSDHSAYDDTPNGFTDR